MAAPLIFRALTSFKFEVGAAVAGSNQLANSVKSISDAATTAKHDLFSIGIGLGTSLGIIPSSFLGMFGMAIRASETFKETQLSIANIISANQDRLTGQIDTFNDRLGVSRTIMRDISQTAKQFSLPEKQLLGFTKLLAPFLIAKGLEGTNFEVSIDIARSLLKSAPTLGLNPVDIQGQLIRAIEGGASKGDPLFRRLTADTQSLGGITSKKFNLLPAAKRVNLLRDALREFSSDAEVISGVMELLNSRIGRLRDSLTGISGILLPIGDVITKFLGLVFDRVQAIVDTSGKAIGRNVAKLLESFISTPEALLTNLLQLKSLSSDLEKTKGIFLFSGGASILGSVLKKLTGIAFFTTPAIGSVVAGLGVLYSALKRTITPLGDLAWSIAKWGFIITSATALIGGISAAIFGFKATIGFLFSGLAFALTKFALPLAITMLGLQLISRAIAKARVSDFKALPVMIEIFSNKMVKLKEAISNVTTPFVALFDTLAEGISPLFSLQNWFGLIIAPMNFMINLFNDMAEAVKLVGSVLAGFVNMLTGLVSQITLQVSLIPDLISALKRGDFDEAGRIRDRSVTGEGLLDLFVSGALDFADKFDTKMSKLNEGKSIAQGPTNIGKIEINNRFREQMEPDRVAFTLVDQLKKLADNPTQARRRGFGTAGIPAAAEG